MPSYFPCIKSSESHPLADFLKPTYMLQLDFDHVKKEDMEQLIQLVRGDNHTMVEYVTVSGRGFRVFCAYRPVDDDDISVLELFNAVLQKAMAYYTQLLGIAPDKQCVDITRCAGLSYDPDAYFRWDAEPFALGPKDLPPSTRRRHCRRSILPGETPREESEAAR